MPSKAATVAQYLAELPPDRRAAIQAVRAVVKKSLGEGFAEGMQYGMIGYYVPHSVYPAGYHCDARQPLPFASLGSQKNHMSLGLMNVYGDPALRKSFEQAWAKTGKRLDMGAACIRFKKVEDLALDAIAGAIRSTPAKVYIARYESSLSASAKRVAAKRAAGKPERAAAAKRARATKAKTRGT